MPEDKVALYIGTLEMLIGTLHDGPKKSELTFELHKLREYASKRGWKCGN